MQGFVGKQRFVVVVDSMAQNVVVDSAVVVVGLP